MYIIISRMGENKYFTISEQSMVFGPIADQNDPSNAIADRLLFREEKCSPDIEFGAKW